MTPQRLVNIVFLCSGLLACSSTPMIPANHNSAFETLAATVVDQLPALSPIGATSLGDHRFDAQFNNVSAETRAREAAFYRGTLTTLDSIDTNSLNRENQIDAALLKHNLNRELWQLETLREWEWNPLVYTRLAGGSIYSLMARDFAPIEQRLKNATQRLEKMPRFLAQVRRTLIPANVPNVHAQTAVSQNKGVISIVEALVTPHIDQLDASARTRLERAIATATNAIDEHQAWLENTLLPAANGDFRLGAERFDRKLQYTLFSPLSRQQVRERAEREFKAVRAQMYDIARELVSPEAPDTPDAATEQAIIEAGLALANAKMPGRDQIVAVARDNLAQATQFVRANDLVEVPTDPVEIIIMPEFQRGFSVAYCDSPGALDRGQKTFYAVAPLPADWTEEQVGSFLREYNLLSIQNLTLHEAMPGHYLQLALANRHPSVLRAMLASGPFIEGWAVYSEGVMMDAGYLDNDPLMRLINKKWYLRAVANAIIDQAIHVEGMTRDEAMVLMTKGAFQEEREAAGKWVRAQLSSTQLSTYFVGYQEHIDMRQEVERAWGNNFSLRRYHDRALSYGSPPVQFVRAQLLDTPIGR